VKAVDVDTIRFEFGESWRVAEKWDDSFPFRDGVARIGSKALDLVGVRQGVLYLIEVKDYRGHPIESKGIQPKALPLDIACKVRDSVAGLVGASRVREESWVRTCADLLLNPRRQLIVIAWIEDAAPRPAEPRAKRDVWHVSWLTQKVSVTSPFSAQHLDVAAASLPGAGQS
jgi:hypothetical protein